MNDWDRVERRKFSEFCPDHNSRIEEFKRYVDRIMNVEKEQEEIKKMLDLISDRQISYITKMQKVEDTINNGLSKAVVNTDKCVTRIEEKITEMCDNFNKRLVPIESFDWFRTWMTSLRNQIFKNVMKLAFWAVLILAAFHTSQRLMDKIFAMIHF